MIEREWVSIRDPHRDRRRYTFDVSFLLSTYSCIYGRGCSGIQPGAQDPAIGCCVHGAYLNDDDDGAAIEQLVREQLDASTMQFHETALRDGVFETDADNERHTRVVDGGCIFANRSGFDDARQGCALHHLGLADGLHHMTYKPTVCWQVPLHRTIDEMVANDGATLEVHTIAAFERGHWGEGGADFDWWCLDDNTAFGAAEPLYRTMDTELRAMVGDAVYDELASYLDSRVGVSSVTFLPIVDTAVVNADGP
ncbi:MAG: hypothetical protein WD576_04980 [Nitriliruptoraceae bacterium]